MRRRVDILPVRPVDPVEMWASATDAVDDIVAILARRIARQHHDAEERALQEARQP